MSNFGQDFLKGFTNVNYLRDYTHASKTFTANQYELKPRFKFLFHVSFTLNTQIPSLNQFVTAGDVSSLSYVVKTVDLPKFNIQTETLNQYNRKRVIQTKIDYQPVGLMAVPAKVKMHKLGLTTTVETSIQMIDKSTTGDTLVNRSVMQLVLAQSATPAASLHSFETLEFTVWISTSLLSTC